MKSPLHSNPSGNNYSLEDNYKILDVRAQYLFNSMRHNLKYSGGGHSNRAHILKMHPCGTTVNLVWCWILDIMFVQRIMMDVAFSILDIGHSHRFVQWMSILVHPCWIYKIIGKPNIQYRYTGWMLHCTNLWECPISNIDIQCRHSLYKPTGMSNIQYRYTM